MMRARFFLMVFFMLGAIAPASASYVPGTIVTPNLLEPSRRLLVLEHSLVDLYHNIEILNFNYTFNKSICDVYKGINGQFLSSKSACLGKYTVYTESAISAADGWRIGTTSDILGVIEAFPGWTRSPPPGDWLTSFTNGRASMVFIENTLGTTRMADGLSSFVLGTGDGIATPNQYAVLLDELNSSGGSAGYRRSQGATYAYTGADRSVLVVRDWLGQERPVNSALEVPVPIWLLSTFGFAALLRRKNKAD